MPESKEAADIKKGKRMIPVTIWIAAFLAFGFFVNWPAMVALFFVIWISNYEY